MSILIDSKGKLTKVAFLNGHCEQTAVKNLKHDYYRVINLSMKHGSYRVNVYDLTCNAIIYNESFTLLSDAYVDYKKECRYHRQELKYRIELCSKKHEKADNILTELFAEWDKRDNENV